MSSKAAKRNEAYEQRQHKRDTVACIVCGSRDRPTYKHAGDIAKGLFSCTLCHERLTRFTENAMKRQTSRMITMESKQIEEIKRLAVIVEEKREQCNLLGMNNAIKDDIEKRQEQVAHYHTAHAEYLKAVNDLEEAKRLYANNSDIEEVDYTAACIVCGTNVELCMTAHRNEDGKMVGWVFSCVSCRGKIAEKAVGL